MATLGLNMIVAAGEGDILQRCLLSAKAQETFDEIVIVNTSTDSNIDRVAGEFGASIHFYQWSSYDYPFGNFAAARNCALLNSSTDYIMWLDTDDIIQNSCQPGLRQLRELFVASSHPDIDAYYMPYILTQDESGNPTSTMFRERVFRRHGDICWVWPVHECLSIEWDEERTSRIDFLQVSLAPESETGKRQCPAQHKDFAPRSRA